MPIRPQRVESPTPVQSSRAPIASQWIDRVSELLAAAVGRKPVWFLAGFSVLYVVGTSALARTNLFWFDEILTYHIARLPTVTVLWATLRSGLDLNPPLFFVVTQFLRSLLGESELVLRIPALVGFWVMCLCLFRFVSRGCTPLYGLVALLLPVATTASKFAYEARPYGLVLGFCGIALVSWQSYARDGSRFGPVLLWLCMTAAVSSHYYALMALLPFAAGEMVRLTALKKWDFKVLGALALSGIPLLFCLPQLRMARSFAATFFSKPSITSFLTYYDFLIGSGQFFIVIALVAAAIISLKRYQVPGIEPSRQAPTPAESAVAIGFVMLPYIAMCFAAVTGSGFAPRYALTAIIGIATLLPMAAYTASRGRMAIGAAFALVFLLAFSMREISASRRFFQGREPLDGFNYLSENDKTVPVVIVNPLKFLQVAHYGSTEWKGRAAYVVDLSDSVSYGEADTADRALVELRKVTPLNVFDYGDFRRTHPRFLVLGSYSWEISYLTDHAADIQVVGNYGKDLLFEVRQKPELR